MPGALFWLTFTLPKKDMVAHVQQQIDVMRLVDARLRPAVQIDAKSIEAYYRDQFVQAKTVGALPKFPLAEVSAKFGSSSPKKK